ncbi:DUF6328 family protein [Streptomyces sp. ISL-11]|uniref:DUF6328 family protein n=1 Tax=Streptomyces sp. ISL-11 TaxID=2819174 RepID=UPI001BEC0E53|nr:DUF6328 family protein [Streptomyces sp. ISL-11]MBT2382938.1 hypothetical protein [Streptomyces sp. ISL-11]
MAMPDKDSEGLNEWGRHESLEERADRRWGELLQELRVAQTGVQILLGFLLTVVFTPRFAALPDTDKDIYVITVVLGAATTAALIGPVSLHRLLTGHRLKPQTVAWASALTLLGLLLLLSTLMAAMLLVLRVALGGSAVTYVVAGLGGWFVLCWFALPVWALVRVRRG